MKRLIALTFALGAMASGSAMGGHHQLPEGAYCHASDSGTCKATQYLMKNAGELVVYQHGDAFPIAGFVEGHHGASCYFVGSIVECDGEFAAGEIVVIQAIGVGDGDWGVGVPYK